MFYLIILILLIVILILFLPIKVILISKIIDFSIHTSIEFSILSNLIKYKYNIPFSKNSENGENRESSESSENSENKEIELLGIINYSKIAKIIFKKISIKKISIGIEIGTNNAYFTSILSGLLWSFCGISFSYIINKYNNLEHKINITPNFSQKIFKIHLLCIFNIKIVHIIIIGFKSIFLIKDR